MQRRNNGFMTAVGLIVALCFAEVGLAQEQPSRQKQGQTSRRSQRVKMEQIEVVSPDGKVRLTIGPSVERLTFTVTLGDKTVIEPSTIVMKVDGYDLSSGIVLGKVERYEIDASYPWHGAHSTAVNRCHGVRIALQHDLSFIDYVLEVRVFNDGAAFRHVVPGDEGASWVPDEYTTFVIPAGSTVWHHDLGGHYEASYNKDDISDLKAGQWAGPPVTFELPHVAPPPSGVNPAGGGWATYASITEANLVNYSGMGLEADGRRGLITGLGHRQPLNYPFELRYGREEGKRLAKPAAVVGTITTPWRVVMVGTDLNALVNSDILPNLCPAPDRQYFPEGIDTPWVKPGRAVWRYLDGGDGSFESLKGFSRMAGELGFEYHILEGVWSRWSDEQIKDIVECSKERGVRLLFWKHSNQLRTPEAREAFFDKLHGLGVAGAKIDFFDHEAKEDIDLYEELLKMAAERQMVLDFHGANKPTGRHRTWPNELVREGIRGMESSSLKERARHEVVLPFTRYLAGPADYTTLHLGARRADSTWAHQIASFAVFASPLLTLAANPQSVLDNPAANVITSIPPVWDETIVLPGSRIGELAIFARRTGGTWFLAVMSGPQGKTIQVPLSFLGDGPYRAMLVRDQKEKADAAALEEKTVQRGDTLTIEMANGGGFLARFVKDKQR